MTTQRNALALAVVFLLALVAVLGYAAFTAAGEPVEKKDDAGWTYLPRQTFNAGPGLLVYCQDKTNSVPFARRIKGKAGDVVITTCRAVVDPATLPKG